MIHLNNVNIELIENFPCAIRCVHVCKHTYTRGALLSAMLAVEVALHFERQAARAFAQLVHRKILGGEDAARCRIDLSKQPHEQLADLIAPLPVSARIRMHHPVPAPGGSLAAIMRVLLLGVALEAEHESWHKISKVSALVHALYKAT